MIWLFVGGACIMLLLLLVVSMCRAAGVADSQADELFARWHTSRHFTPELDFTLDFAHQPTEDKHAPVLHERLR